MEEPFDSGNYYTSAKGRLEEFIRRSEFEFLVLQRDAYRNLLELALKFPDQRAQVKSLQIHLEKRIDKWQSDIHPQIREMREKYEKIKHPTSKEVVDHVVSWEEELRDTAILLLQDLRALSIKKLPQI